MVLALEARLATRTFQQDSQQQTHQRRYHYDQTHLNHSAPLRNS